MGRAGTSAGDSQPLSRKVQVTSLFSCSTCGLAEELEQEKSSLPKSACGNVNHFVRVLWVVPKGHVLSGWLPEPGRCFQTLLQQLLQSFSWCLCALYHCVLPLPAPVLPLWESGNRNLDLPSHQTSDLLREDHPRGAWW